MTWAALEERGDEHGCARRWGCGDDSHIHCPRGSADPFLAQCRSPGDGHGLTVPLPPTQCCHLNTGCSKRRPASCAPLY